MKWHGAEAQRRIEKELADRLTKAAIHVKNKAKINISQSQPTMLIHPRTGGSRRIGLDPSQPGEFPKKVSGFLRNRVNHEVDRRRLIARVGTNVPYGKWLEIGTRRMRSRPWLRRTLMMEASFIRRQFGVGRKI